MTNTPGSNWQQCPLCGHQFEMSDALQACSNCPLNPNCKIYCCPNCHYQFIVESKTLGWLSQFKQRWFKKDE